MLPCSLFIFIMCSHGQLKNSKDEELTFWSFLALWIGSKCLDFTHPYQWKTQPYRTLHFRINGIYNLTFVGYNQDNKSIMKDCGNRIRWRNDPRRLRSITNECNSSFKHGNTNLLWVLLKLYIIKKPQNVNSLYSKWNKF